MTVPGLKIAVLGINYAPERTGVAPYTTGLATALASHGHDVHVFTGYPHYPEWRRHGSADAFRSDDLLNGVQVHRFMHPVPKRFSWLGRVVMELIFGMQVATARWGKPDVVICVTPPLLTAGIAMARARLTPRRPAVGILVQDIYSRGITETQVAPKLVGSLIRALESLTIRMADGVSTIHPGFTDDITTNLGVDPTRVREIRNWTHVGEPSLAASREFRSARGWDSGETVVLHAGNMGYKQGLENVVAAAAIAQESGVPVRFVLLGNGNQRDILERDAKGIRALEFIDTVDEADFPAVLASADVLLVNERPGVAHMSVPSKLTSYFKVGKPILAATDPTGYAAKEIEASGAGVRVAPDRPDLLVQEAIRLREDKELAVRLGDAGRRYSDKKLSAEASIDAYEEWVGWLAHSRPRGGAFRRWFCCSVPLSRRPLP